MNNPASRTTDPETSHEAERHMNDSGKRASHCQLVARWVELMPGSTAGELGELTGLGHHETQRRLSDLHNRGRVRRGERRQCNINLTQMMTWYTL